MKWAQSSDGFMDINRENAEKGSFQISSKESSELVHKWRSEESSIMVGTNTVINDNPKLTTRLAEGRNALRVTVDKSGRIPENSHLLNDGNDTLIYTSNVSSKEAAVEYDIDLKGSFVIKKRQTLKSTIVSIAYFFRN